MEPALPLKLKVEVLKARNLIAADSNGKSDPYCRVSLGQKIFNTSVQPNTLNPEWQESIAFITDQLSPFATLQGPDSPTKVLLLGYLLLEVWDHDFGNPDDFIGRLMVPLASLPLAQVDGGKEQWYPLHRNSSRPVSGDILLKIHLEAFEDDLVLTNEKLNKDFLTVSTALSYQLPVLLDNEILNFPGSSEVVEIGFSKVYIEVGSVSTEAMLLLTNYRLIVLSTSDTKGGGATNNPASTASHQVSNLDLNMWIALNNIASVEQGSGSTVVRRHVSGAAENVESVTVTIQCYDSRYIQVVFVMSTENSGVIVVNPNQQPLPLKILKKVTEQAGNIQRNHTRAIKKKLKHLKKMKRKPHPQFQPLKEDDVMCIVDRDIIDPARRRSGAFSTASEVTDLKAANGSTNANANNGINTGSQSELSLEECDNMEEMESCEETEEEDDDDCIIEVEREEGVDGEDDIDGEVAATPFKNKSLKQPLSQLEMAYQNLTFPMPTKTLVSSFILRLEDITANMADHPPAYLYTSSESIKDHYPVRWDIISNVLQDMQRFMSDDWRVCAINSQEYEICPSYPQLLFIPADMKKDPEIEEVAKFRSKGRIPSLVWMNKKTKSFLLRSAQPLTGTSGKHCKEDERLIDLAMASGPVGGGMTIFDARSFAAVQGNKLMGKGTEDVNNYPGCKLVYLDIPNIHAVRESYDAVKSLASSASSSKWLSNLENTQWLAYISLILKGTSLIARYLGYQDGSALVHCSDGWDRTSQLTSLTQLMIDSYYRTIDGFMVLIDKEWLAYGHKFRDRLGYPQLPNERSPIFLQFLDCVHQMVHQYGNCFEFTSSLLLCIAEHINTRWFGSFLCNCDRERQLQGVYSKTLPLSVHLAAIRHTLINPQYQETNEILIPSWTIRRLAFWDSYFLAWDGTSIVPVGGALGDNDVNVVTQETTDGQSAQQPGQLEHKESDTVVWMADDKVKSCLLCQQKFSFTRRKHHCRNCGRIYCHECSKQRVTLSHLGYSEAVRVCDNCFRIHNSITTNRATSNVESRQEDGFQVLEVIQRSVSQ